MDYTKNDLAVILKELDGVIVPNILNQVEGVSRAYGGQQEGVQKMIGTVGLILIRKWVQSVS